MTRSGHLPNCLPHGFLGKYIMGAMSLEGITYQNDNFDWCKRQVMPALPILYTLYRTNIMDYSSARKCI